MLGFLVLLHGCSGAALVAEPLRHARAQSVTVLASASASGQVLDTLEVLDAVWSVRGDGSLFSKSLVDSEIAHHLTEEHVVAIHSPRRGQLWALTQDPDTDDLRVWHLLGRTWEPKLEWLGSGTMPVALTDVDGAAVVVTPHVVYVQQGDNLAAADLDEPLPGEHARTKVTPSGTVFLGFAKSRPDLRAIDPWSGASRPIECGDIGCPDPSYFVPHPSGDDCVVSTLWRDDGPSATWACTTSGAGTER